MNNNNYFPVAYKFVKIISKKKEKHKSIFCKKYNDSDYRIKRFYKQIVLIK